MRMQIWQESQARRQAEILHQEQGQAEEEVVQWDPSRAVDRVSRSHNGRIRWCWCYRSPQAASVSCADP